MGVATTWHINRTWLAKAPIMHLMWLSRVACCLTVWGLCCSTVCSLCYVCDTGMYSLSTLSLHTPVFCLSLAILSSFNTYKKTISFDIYTYTNKRSQLYFYFVLLLLWIRSFNIVTEKAESWTWLPIICPPNTCPP